MEEIVISKETLKGCQCYRSDVEMCSTYRECKELKGKYPFCVHGAPKGERSLKQDLSPCNCGFLGCPLAHEAKFDGKHFCHGESPKDARTPHGENISLILEPLNATASVKEVL